MTAATARDEYYNISEAAQEGHLLDIKDFLKQDPRLLERQDSMGWTPLCSAARSGRLDCVQYLIEQGCVVNHIAVKGGSKTALILASYAGHLEVVKTLCAHGADRNLKDDLGFTALSIAVSQDPNTHAEIVAFLKSDS
jgi:ankyrin repeat protein